MPLHLSNAGAECALPLLYSPEYCHHSHLSTQNQTCSVIVTAVSIWIYFPWLSQGKKSWSVVGWLGLTLKTCGKLYHSFAGCHILLGYFSKEFFLFGFFFFFWYVVSCPQRWPRTHYVAKTGLEFLILLPPYPECWDCRHVLASLVYALLGFHSC